MPKVSPEARHEVEEALKQYVEEVEQSALAEKSRRAYVRHATTFVRWLNDDFVPGERA